jgi:hypothetical protein
VAVPRQGDLRRAQATAGGGSPLGDLHGEAGTGEAPRPRARSAQSRPRSRRSRRTEPDGKYTDCRHENHAPVGTCGTRPEPF